MTNPPPNWLDPGVSRWDYRSPRFWLTAIALVALLILWVVQETDREPPLTPLPIPGSAGSPTDLAPEPSREPARRPTTKLPDAPIDVAATSAWGELLDLDVLRQRLKTREEAQAVLDTLTLIAAGGPFPYSQDGAVFQNRERRLPRQPRGYYHEYTVETPRSDDRGARRIVTGEEHEVYYTRDHYQSFLRLDGAAR